jgi:hypothetical protein
MNQRIQELAKQAVLQANEVFDQKGKDYSGIVMEKFAELIVGECIRKINDIAESSNNPQPIYRVAVDLLEHFGVEE